MQKQLCFFINPLAENIGKPVLDKLQKQFSIYVPLIQKTFSAPVSWKMKTIILAVHTSFSPFFLALDTAFLMQLFPLLSPHTSPWCSCLLAWICLVDSNSPIKIEIYRFGPEVW